MAAMSAVGRMTHAGGTAARRFPFALLSAVVAAVAGVVFLGGLEDADFWLRVLVAAGIGIPLFLRVGLASERRGVTGTRA